MSKAAASEAVMDTKRSVKILITALVYLASLMVVAGCSFVVVLLLAGPHAGLLPYWLEGVALGLGWFAVLVLPILAARKTWRRFH